MSRFRRYNDFIKFYDFVPDKFSQEQKIIIECALAFFSLVKYNRYFVRMIGYFLLRTQVVSFDVKTVALLTSYSYRQMRTIAKLSPKEFAQTYEQPPCGPGRTSAIPQELVGDIALWIIENRCDCPSKITAFLQEQYQIEVCAKTVSRFLQKYGLDQIVANQLSQEEMIGRTKFLGGWLLFPFILKLLRNILPIFAEKARAAFCAVFLTIFYMSLYKISRLFHLVDISDVGFALLTSRNRILSRTSIWAWIKSCPKSLIQTFYHRSRPEINQDPQAELTITIDEHVIVRWTETYEMHGTLWPTRGKSGKADKVFYVYALAKRLLLSCLPLPANRNLYHCMVKLVKDIRETYGVYYIRVILDAGGCKGLPLAKLMKIPGVIFVVKARRSANLVRQWEEIPRSEFKCHCLTFTL